MARETGNATNDAPEGWAAFAGRLAAQREPVTEFEVRKLAARVRAATPARGVRASRSAVLAAAAMLAAATLTGLFAGQQGRMESAGAAARADFQVDRRDDGAVVIRFADAGRPHRVATTRDPGDRQAPIRTAYHGQFVESGAGQETQPGSVTFYRID